MIKQFLAGALLALTATQAWAGSTTYAVTVGSGTNFDAVTDGSGNLGSKIAVCDGSALANCGAVKAASTAAVATDPAAVVSLSPNSPLPAGANALGSLTAGSAIIGKVGIDQTTPGSTNGVQVNAALPAGSNTIGAVTGALTTSGGWTPGITAAVSTTVTSIKSSAGQLGKMLCYNPNATVAYVQIFNIASGSVTLGSSTPVDVVPVPATLNGGFTMPFPGEQFGTAISYAATTTATGSIAPGTALTCSYGYN